MIIENLPSLQIHRLTEAQYQKLVDAGKADDKALYLVPDDQDIDIDISQEIGTNPSPEEIPSSKAVADYVEANIPKFTTDLDPDNISNDTITTAKVMVEYVGQEIEKVEENIPEVVGDLSINTFSRGQKVPSVQATINYVNDQIISAQPNVVETIDTTNLGGKIPSDAATVNYVNTYVNGEIAALIGDDSRYPLALDTINEISAAIKDNVETLDILNEAIASKVNQTEFNTFKANNDQSIANLNSAVELKTNQSDFEAFQTEHAQIVTNLEQGIEGRVSQSVYNTDLSALRSTLEQLDEKADTKDLEDYIEQTNATIETLATKAEVDTRVSKNTYTTDLSLIREALETASELINTKADQENLDGLALTLEGKANKDETSAAIAALDDRIDATDATLKTKVNNSDIVNDAILAGSNKIPTTGLVYSFVKGEIAIPEAVRLEIWNQEDGWYHVTSTLQVSTEISIELNDESILLKQGQHFICWQPNGDTITGWSDGSNYKYAIRSATEEIVAGSTALPTAQAVIDYVDAALVDYTPTTPDWDAAEGEPGYIKNKPGNATVNPDTGETEVVKIESQYVETITKVEDTTAQANEIPTVSAVQELIQQAIDESLYVDEEEYV